MRYIILLMIIAINAGCHRNGDKMELGLTHTLFENLLEFFRIKSSFRDNIPFGLLYNVIPMVQKEMC